MRNRNILNILALIFLLVGIGCSKNDNTVASVPETIIPTEEIGYYNLLSSIIPNTIIQDFNWDPLTSEIGYSFTPKVSGKITALEAKLPYTQGLVDVHIWDFDTKNLLRTETLNMALANTIIKKNISALNLIANKKYVISIETNVWYRYQKNSPNTTSFSYTFGNITFNNPVFSSRDVFPENTNDSSYFQGDIAFTFLKN